MQLAVVAQLREVGDSCLVKFFASTAQNLREPVD